MSSLPHRLSRTVVIQAHPETVFRYFTDGGRWAAWWGKGSAIDARAGGRVTIRFPGGLEVVGEVLEIVAPRRISFTYGFASGRPIGPGESRVHVRLEDAGGATRLHLEHEFQDAATRDEHEQGWRHQLSVFANVVTDEVHGPAAERIDAWFAAWSEADPARRREAFERLVVADVHLRDRFSSLVGLAELLPHVAAFQRFVPGVRTERRGPVRHCQGTVLAEWTALGAEGRERGRGTSIFDFDPDGRIAAVTGFAQETVPDRR